MMRKLLLATLFILQLSILPSWGAETVLIEKLTSMFKTLKSCF